VSRAVGGGQSRQLSNRVERKPRSWAPAAIGSTSRARAPRSTTAAAPPSPGRNRLQDRLYPAILFNAVEKSSLSAGLPRRFAIPDGVPFKG